MLLPWRALFAHGLQTREPLTHTRGQGDFGGLSCMAPTSIDALADRMVPHGHQGAHRPHGAPLSPASPDGPLAPQSATIPVARGDAHQGRDLLPAAGPPLRAVSNQRRREDWAHAGGGSDAGRLAPATRGWSAWLCPGPCATPRDDAPAP